MSTNTRVSIYDRHGGYLTDIESRCTRSWVLDAIGVAKITVATNDPKVTVRNFFPGNLILIENDRLGAWGGVLWTPQDFLVGSLQVTAYTPEYLLRQRRVRQQSITGTAGALFTQLINLANIQEDTQIRLGTVTSDGPSWTETLKYQSIYDMLIKLHDKTGQDWSIEPRIDTGGKLVFDANWHWRRGTDWNYRFEEGVHIERPSGAGMQIQTDPANDILAYGNSGSATQALYSNKINQTSVDLYGLRQTSFGVDATTADNLSAVAQAKLDELSYPINQHKLVIVDEPNTADADKRAFRYSNLGDSIIYNAAHYGWSPADGTIGQGDTRIRIIAREFDETQGKMPVTVYEV